MRAWGGLGSQIIDSIEQRAACKRLQAEGPLGDFYRQGGNEQLYVDLPLSQDDLVLDAGGYQGEWTASILTRYGCRSELFEPVPDFGQHCRRLYRHNGRVRVPQAALGGTSRTTAFSLAENGTSELLGEPAAAGFEVRVVSIGEFLSSLDVDGALERKPGVTSVVMLNIESGEYGVLESLLESDAISRFRCLLIQFHRQPPGWELRHEQIIDGLRKTHESAWCYPMVWEKWIR